jgi:hypothetical protein
MSDSTESLPTHLTRSSAFGKACPFKALLASRSFQAIATPSRRDARPPAVTFYSGIAALTKPLFIGGNLNHLTSTDTEDDPIVVVYRHVEGIERVMSLAGLPVLDLIAQDELRMSP